ncbi:MAG: FprA family A-type flavoprotein [Muribaculaceae bacterium]|nr:FprA family A-type flavoprotein [Muribaculaceae bacterium]
MDIRKITERVSYVGVNDRVTNKFENLWPLPHGVSYNSYLVKGSEKIALIDGVEVTYIRALRTHIENNSGGQKIDYLIVNHMEPDHSGAIPLLLDIYPEMKIIGNKITIGMLQGFYNISESQCEEVKDNDVLSLGDVSLKFIMTPLVHWPETMMTYLEEDKVLFSGDAFGCFGALNGGILDTEMNTDWYFPEMYRYYSNIVGKFGRQVQMALKKTDHLDVKYLCSTHGPVWHDRISEVIDIYNRLSLYEGEEGVTIIYGTMYGNTGEIADEIANRLCERGVKNIKVHNAGKSEMSYMISDAFRYKGLIIGCPTYNGSMFPEIDAFMKAMMVREIKNRVIALFGSYTWASAACKSMNECLEKLKMSPVATLDMRQAPSADDTKEAKRIADAVADAMGF